MDVGDIALVIGALLGGTGAGGLLTGGVQISRRHRLRRSVEKTADVVAKLPGGSSEAAAFEAVQKVESARFAAMTLVVLPLEVRRYVQSIGVYVAALVLGGFVLIAVLLAIVPPRNPGTPRGPFPPEQAAWLLASAALAVLYVAACDRWLRCRREIFVELVLAGHPFSTAQEAAMRDTIPEWALKIAAVFFAWRRHRLVRRRARKAFVP